MGNEAAFVLPIPVGFTQAYWLFFSLVFSRIPMMVLDNCAH